MSSLVLVEGVEPAGPNPDAADPLIFSGKRVVPHLAPSVEAAAKPLFYFVVYPDSTNSSKPTIRVQFFNDGSLIGTRRISPLLTPPALSPCSSASATRPGDWEVKVMVTQGADSAAGSLLYQVNGPINQ